jgi:hypothetical protein
VQAFKVVVGSEPLFSVIKAEAQARIQETAVTTEALLPGGPYDLWRADANAIHVRLSLPRGRPPQPTPGSASPTVREIAPVTPGTLVAEADMQDYELQGLAEQASNLTRETVDLNLRFHLRVELSPTAQISDATLTKVNEIMAEVSEKLKLERG